MCKRARITAMRASLRHERDHDHARRTGVHIEWTTRAADRGHRSHGASTRSRRADDRSRACEHRCHHVGVPSTADPDRCTPTEASCTAYDARCTPDDARCTPACDPVSWTRSERRIRCPACPTRSAGVPGGSLMRSSAARPSGWPWTKGRASAPSKVSLAALNAVLRELGHPPATQADLAPVLAA